MTSRSRDAAAKRPPSSKKQHPRKAAAKRPSLAKVAGEGAGDPDRKSYLGGSDAASIMGTSPWRSAFRCWTEKVGATEPADLSGKFYIYWGNVLEGVVADEFSRRTGMAHTPAGFVRHRHYPFIAGHPDRLLPAENTFLECKTSNAWDYSHWGVEEAGRDGIPLHYLAQVDHYMAVLDSADHCYLAVLIGGSDYRCYRIERSRKAEKELIAAEREMWHRIQTDDPPPVRSESDARMRWREAQEGVSKAVDEKMFESVRKLGELQTVLSAARKQEKALRDLVIPAFEAAESLSFDGRRIARLTNYSSSSFDLEEFREAHPKVAKKFTKLVPSRRLKVLI